MLGVWGQNILLQPVQGHAEELNHLESNVLPWFRSTKLQTKPLREWSPLGEEHCPPSRPSDQPPHQPKGFVILLLIIIMKIDHLLLDLLQPISLLKAFTFQQLLCQDASSEPRHHAHGWSDHLHEHYCHHLVVVVEIIIISIITCTRPPWYCNHCWPPCSSHRGCSPPQTLRLWLVTTMKIVNNDAQRQTFEKVRIQLMVMTMKLMTITLAAGRQKSEEVETQSTWQNPSLPTARLPEAASSTLCQWNVQHDY